MMHLQHLSSRGSRAIVSKAVVYRNAYRNVRIFVSNTETKLDANQVPHTLLGRRKPKGLSPLSGIFNVTSMQFTPRPSAREALS